jgi:hypothetical protein
MFVFAIETDGRVVALTKEADPLMLEGFLNGARDEGKHLRHLLRSDDAWNGVSPLTARRATEDEVSDYDDYHLTAEGFDDDGRTCEIESRWYYVPNQQGAASGKSPVVGCLQANEA